jgi:hypothetical protein
MLPVVSALGAIMAPMGSSLGGTGGGRIGS